MGESIDQSKIWFTYHWEAIKATRKAVSLDPTLKVREEKTDECLVCNQHRCPDQFSKSLLAIVMCVFVIEYRINGIAQREGIQQNKKVRSYIKYEPDTVDSYIPYDTKKERTCNKEKKFKYLSLYEKWRNIVEISGKKVTQEYLQEYLKSVQKLQRWIWMRNKIAHGDYEEILRFEISPEKAVDCYEDITEAIFELANALGHDSRQKNEENRKKMSLRQ